MKKCRNCKKGILEGFYLFTKCPYCGIETWGISKNILLKNGIDLILTYRKCYAQNIISDW